MRHALKMRDSRGDNLIAGALSGSLKHQMDCTGNVILCKSSSYGFIAGRCCRNRRLASRTGDCRYDK